jgi:hypothetical protein
MVGPCGQWWSYLVLLVKLMSQCIHMIHRHARSHLLLKITIRNANNVVVTYDTRSPDSTGNINTRKFRTIITRTGKITLNVIRNSRTSSMEQMNTNKKNEYYSSEDTVKVKIGEKLTWKRVVAFFDRCLFVIVQI